VCEPLHATFRTKIASVVSEIKRRPISVLSHLDQSDDDNVELKIKTKVNLNCKIVKL
jgi:hypothetical protein